MLWLRPLLLVLLAVQTALAATTVDKKVDCDKGDTITAAAADLAVDKIYVLHVSGTCNENVVIDNFEGVSLGLKGDVGTASEFELRICADLNILPFEFGGCPHISLSGLRRTAKLRAVAPEMIDRNRVTPGDVVDGNVEGCRQPLAFRGAWRVVSGGDSFDQLCFQATRFDQRVKARSSLFHQACERFHASTRMRWFSLSPM
jgi:hypothetical protein